MKGEPAFNFLMRRGRGIAQMRATTEEDAAASPASEGKAPRTARGERTLRKILDGALEEFGERGFSEGSIVGITRRAGVALGTFYTYFDSKDAVFKALVSDMSARVRDHVAPVLKTAADTLDGEGKALESYLEFARSHQQVYRIIDEAEFADPEGFEKHYRTTAARIAARLDAGKAKGEVAASESRLASEVEAWAIMGMNVFLGLRFAVWGREKPKDIARLANRMIRRGLEP